MSRLFYHVMQDNVGNLLFDVSGTMRLAGSGTLATIYGDEALTIILPNPMTNHPSYGSFKCFLGAGDYDFYMAKAGYSFETLTGVQGHGTMAQQNASAIAVTGGTMVGLTYAALGGGVFMPARLNATFDSGNSALATRPVASGTQYPVTFQNHLGNAVGTIANTDVATAYNTTSDSRLKKLVETLTGELDAIQALRPVRFHWRADDSPGYGFIAAEVQQALPDANIVTGTPDAMNEDGTINPQMIDHSKLVVWLVGACKTLAAKLEAAEARLAILEDALGI